MSEALKAYGSAKDPSFFEKVTAAGEKAAEGVSNALVKEEAGNADEPEDNENQGEAFTAAPAQQEPAAEEAAEPAAEE